MLRAMLKKNQNMNSKMMLRSIYWKIGSLITSLPFHFQK